MGRVEEQSGNLQRVPRSAANLRHNASIIRSLLVISEDQIWSNKIITASKYRTGGRCHKCVTKRCSDGNPYGRYLDSHPSTLGHRPQSFQPPSHRRDIIGPSICLLDKSFRRQNISEKDEVAQVSLLSGDTTEVDQIIRTSTMQT